MQTPQQKTPARTQPICHQGDLETAVANFMAGILPTASVLDQAHWLGPESPVFFEMDVPF
jgi:hypothetical protein